MTETEMESGKHGTIRFAISIKFQTQNKCVLLITSYTLESNKTYV